MKRPKRLTYRTWPDPVIVLVDTPQRNCGVCGGTGFFDVADVGGESAYAEPCDCYDWWDHRLIVRIPWCLVRLYDRIRYRRTDLPF